MHAPRRQLKDRVGTMLSEKYRLERLLGIGGMAAVYEAENTWTGRRVAIKLLKADVEPDSDTHARFLQEARAAARVEHPNIVQVLDLGRDGADGPLFLVEEFLTGTDLRAVLDERGALPPRAALEIAVPLIAALSSAHRQGIIHRDIKPANIFLARSASGEVVPKLLDFGIAKVLEPDGSSGGDLTRAGTTMGTPEYMSPEQANGDRSLGPQTDVWSMGVVLYEMLAGRCPFENLNYHALLAQIIWTAIPRLDGVTPAVPGALADVVHHAAERDRAARYASMREFLDGLLTCPAFVDEPWHRVLAANYGAPPTMQSSHSLEHIVMRAPSSTASSAASGEQHVVEAATTELHHGPTDASRAGVAEFDGDVPPRTTGAPPAPVGVRDEARPGRARFVIASAAIAIIGGAAIAGALHLRTLPPLDAPRHATPSLSSQRVVPVVMNPLPVTAVLDAATRATPDAAAVVEADASLVAGPTAPDPAAGVPDAMMQFAPDEADPSLASPHRHRTVRHRRHRD